MKTKMIFAIATLLILGSLSMNAQENSAQTKQTKRTIHVATAGTLPNLISEDEKYQIEELTVSGELNGTDFKFIREMAGDIVSYKDVPTKEKKLPNLTVFHNPTDGILTSLDISNAKIVEGGEYYNYVRDMNHGISGLSTIGNKITPGLFSQTNLKSIILPNSIISIEGMKYGYMYFTDGPATFEEHETAYISAFPHSLTSVTIPNSVTSIGDHAFRGCSGLTSVTIPNSVTSIGSGAFYGCSGLTSVTIPNSVTSIGGGAFQRCSGLTSVTIPNSVTSIGDYAFQGCSGLTSVTIPNSVTSIGDYAFQGCSGLTSVTIPNSVTSVGNYAFKGCSSLTSVTIPNSVTSIGRDAFYNTGWYNNQANGLLYLDKWLLGYKGDKPVGELKIV